MAENENQTPAAVEESPYTIRVEDAGPATKKVSVEIPKETVSAKIAEQFKELRQGALINGFRKGHAPARLVEKRFAADVKEQVRRTLISESYEQAVEKHNLQVLGEPEFENPDQIKLDENAPLSYTFSIEVQPDINIPDLKGIPVKKPKIEITDSHIDQAMLNLREQQGTMAPVEDRGVQTKDIITADLHVKVDGNVVSHQHDAQIVVRPSRVAGLWVGDFDTQLAGAKPGETRDVVVKVPDDSPAENLRGKDVHLEFTLKDIKQLQPAEINQEFLDLLGFKDEAELRAALREQMEERITFDVQQALRQQVTDHLLSNTSVELPTRLSSRQTDRVVNRRALDLLMRGIPEERIEASLEQLRSGAAEQGSRELKTFFILQKIAQDLQVDVNEGELNGRVAMLAMQRGERPEKLRQEMAKSGMLANLYVQMREEKALDRILEDAKVEEVEPTAEQQKTGEVGSADAKSEGESSAT